MRTFRSFEKARRTSWPSLARRAGNLSRKDGIFARVQAGSDSFFTLLHSLSIPMEALDPSSGCYAVERSESACSCCSLKSALRAVCQSWTRPVGPETGRLQLMADLQCAC